MAFHRTVTTPFEAVSQSKGALHTIAAPSPRAPHPGSDSATVNVLLRHQHEGTFLTRLDTHGVLSLTVPALDFILKILLPGELTPLSVLPRPSRFLRVGAEIPDVHRYS